ncbi:FeoA family protein [Parvularcula maris]|uniref:Ferrous iron transport protein A n=1 Tax=Parvularcula maris TaxID=2965077 RepID=A0A9X2L6D5_9PROT|nr:FeoA family protein [Parvularcula maris]MCQ8183934.1 ferrous iron transport protein A [Parvularcula maris]
MQAFFPLSQSKLRAPARIVSFRGDEALTAQLQEQGFATGETVEVQSRGLFGGSPLAVRLGRTVIALRKSEADALMVEPV